jgi:hypothetical protein
MTNPSIRPLDLVLAPPLVVHLALNPLLLVLLALLARLVLLVLLPPPL